MTGSRNLEEMLRLAIVRGRTGTVLRLLEDKVPQSPSARGNTPLHLAASLAKHEMVTLLLKYGADPSKRNTPTERHPKGVVPIRLIPHDKGEDTYRTMAAFAECKTDHNDSSEYGLPFLFLVDKKQYKTATALLKAGANPDAFGCSDNRLALHCAIQHNASPENLELIKLLLKDGSRRTSLHKIDDSKSYMPVEIAVNYKRFDVLELFAKMPAGKDDVCLKNNDTYKLLIIKSCIEEFKELRETSSSFANRITILLKKLEPAYRELLEVSGVDVTKVFSILEEASKTFYENVMEKYLAKLKIFCPVELKNIDERVQSPIRIQETPSSPIKFEDKKKPGNSNFDSVRELVVINSNNKNKPSESPLIAHSLLSFPSVPNSLTSSPPGPPEKKPFYSSRAKF